MNARNIATRPIVLLLVLVALTSVGCQRSVDERNALMEQNRQAQAEINRLRMANDSLMSELAAANAEASRLLSENARLRAGQATVAPTVNQGNTGFEDIENIDVNRTGNRVTVNVASDILFASGQAELRNSARQTLTQVAGVLQGQYAGREIHIVGYTDSDPIRRSGWEDNLELSLQRAASVHRYLSSQGLDDEFLTAAGRGATHPLATKAASRRVEIIVILNQ